MKPQENLRRCGSWPTPAAKDPLSLLGHSASLMAESPHLELNGAKLIAVIMTPSWIPPTNPKTRMRTTSPCVLPPMALSSFRVGCAILRSREAGPVSSLRPILATDPPTPAPAAPTPGRTHVHSGGSPCGRARRTPGSLGDTKAQLSCPLEIPQLMEIIFSVSSSRYLLYVSLSDRSKLNLNILNCYFIA
ncbi:hypothetical protein X777_15829 [Ooceraea biroi]|uniref:Uncharacterized protein n=1 Tax=Ooceraea biroi TaxID=2015173 RepID=A0A026WT48_OOCBI|nr:hypothetical protein X777_15829 [Ooceraea biroi]